MLIEPDPIIGKRELEDAQPMLKKNQQTGARRCNAMDATSLDISKGNAPRRTTKERVQ